MTLPVAILVPVFNDWASLQELVRQLDRVAASMQQPLILYVVDDGSVESLDIQIPQLTSIYAVHFITLVRNLGHQRALAVGLAKLAQETPVDSVIVMDSDGEDRPEDIPRLLELHDREPDNIIVAQRTQRSESRLFRVFYKFYQQLFYALTSEKIDFGNFCLIPVTRLRHFTYDPNLWNHLAATIRRSRLPITKLQTSRGHRYAGVSKMNFLSLVLHGLSAISVYLDIMAVRMLILSLIVMLGAVAGVAVTVYVRFFTPLAIPGWATNVVGLLVILLFQTFIFSAVLAIVILNRRSYLLITPATDGLRYIYKYETWCTQQATPATHTHEITQ